MPQATIARWERDDRHPSLAETQTAVRACGLDLAVNLVSEDVSWWPQIAVAEMGPALEALSARNVLAVIIGELAGALHGWPLVLSGTGTVEVSGEANQSESSSSPRLTRGEDVYAMAAGSGARSSSNHHARPAPCDLLRGAPTLDLPTGSVPVAGVRDLLRIADAEAGRRRSRGDPCAPGRP